MTWQGKNQSRRNNNKMKHMHNGSVYKIERGGQRGINQLSKSAECEMNKKKPPPPCPTTPHHTHGVTSFRAGSLIPVNPMKVKSDSTDSNKLGSRRALGTTAGDDEEEPPS